MLQQIATISKSIPTSSNELFPIISREEYHDITEFKQHVEEDEHVLDSVAESSGDGCSCSRCVAQCYLCAPGAPTPEQVISMLQCVDRAECLKKFDMNYYTIGKNGDFIQYLLPRRVRVKAAKVNAVLNSLGIDRSGDIENCKCVFLTEDNRCSCHNDKPIECKITYGHSENPLQHSNVSIINKWNSDIGIALVNEWKQVTGFSNTNLRFTFMFGDRDLASPSQNFY